MRDYALRRDAERLVRAALDEDLPAHDLTTRALGLDRLRAEAILLAKEDLVASGLDVAALAFTILDPAVVFEGRCEPGDRVAAGTTMATVSGCAASVLASERTALNFLQRLCGIATAAREAVARLGGGPAVLLDTRKTTPGWRLLEKAAVLDGGARNHRFSLSDGVLIKDNHVALCGGVRAAVTRARAALPPRTRIEVEVSSEAQLEEAIEAGADVVLLDNFGTEGLASAARRAAGRVVLEASGGIGPARLAQVASTGVDLISSGALTHSARAVDISLEITRSGPLGG